MAQSRPQEPKFRRLGPKLAPADPGRTQHAGGRQGKEFWHENKPRQKSSRVDPPSQRLGVVEKVRHPHCLAPAPSSPWLPRRLNAPRSTRRRSASLVINESCHQPSPPRGHLRLVRPKEPVSMPPPVVVKQEHVEMAADLDTGLKWSRDDYVLEEMKPQRRALEEIAERRRALEEIAERRRGREEAGVLVLADDEEAPAPTNPVRSGDPGQGCSKDGGDDDDDGGGDYTAFYSLLGMN